MALNDYPDIKTIWIKYRFFGRTEDLPDEDKMDIFWKFNDKFDLRLNDKDKVYIPLIRKERKIIFENKNYGDKIQAASIEVNIKWTSNDEYAQCMNTIISIFLNQKNEYKQRKKINEGNKSGDIDNKRTTINQHDHEPMDQDDSDSDSDSSSDLDSDSSSNRMSDLDTASMNQNHNNNNGVFNGTQPKSRREQISHGATTKANQQHQISQGTSNQKSTTPVSRPKVTNTSKRKSRNPISRPKVTNISKHKSINPISKSISKNTAKKRQREETPEILLQENGNPFNPPKTITFEIKDSFYKPITSETITIPALEEPYTKRRKIDSNQIQNDHAIKVCNMNKF